MLDELTFVRPDGNVVEVRVTGRNDGDFHIDREPAELASIRARVMDGPWAVVRQVHGNRIVEADPSSEPVEADGIITDRIAQPIAVQGADCAPLGFVTQAGPIGAAHVGWRGLLGGVVEAMIDRLAKEGAHISNVVVGPCIGPECYEFGEPDLTVAESRYGSAVRGVTSTGRPALDLRAGILVALHKADVPDVRFVGGCTACEMAGYSHRVRREQGRHTLVTRIVEGR